MRINTQLAACLIILSAVSCTAAKPQVKVPQNVREEITWTSQQKVPGWYLHPPKSDDRYHYFVGESLKASTRVAAMDEAMDHATRRFLGFCGKEATISYISSKETVGKTDEVLSGTITSIQIEKTEMKEFVHSVKAKEWYLSKLRIFHDDIPVKYAWNVLVLVQVPVGVATEIIKKNEKKWLFKMRNTETEKEKTLSRSDHRKPMLIGETGEKIKVYYDADTNLEWLAGPDENTTWKDAYFWVNGLGGGWRMPTIKEMKGLYKEGEGCRNMPPKLKTTGWWVWSNEPDEDLPERYLGFIFGAGCVATIYHSHSHNGRGFAVRP